ncbi:MAG: hypothetical protein RTU30_13455 [Candidatus Thorarchaeota archaeon]
MRNFDSFFDQKRGDVRKQRTAIEEAIRSGHSSVSSIAEATTLPKDLILWNLIGMMRWGTVEVAGEEHHELLYKLKEV